MWHYGPLGNATSLPGTAREHCSGHGVPAPGTREHVPPRSSLRACARRVILNSHVPSLKLWILGTLEHENCLIPALTHTYTHIRHHGERRVFLFPKIILAGRP